MPKPVSNPTSYCLVPPVSPATTARNVPKEVFRSWYPYLTYLQHLSFLARRPELIFRLSPETTAFSYAFRSSQAGSWHHLSTSYISALFVSNKLKIAIYTKKTPFYEFQKIRMGKTHCGKEKQDTENIYNFPSTDNIIVLTLTYLYLLFPAKETGNKDK